MHIRKKSIGEKEYYYLVYNYRQEGKVKTIDKEIGNEIPQNIEELKEKFTQKIVKKRWIEEIEKITEKYRKILNQALEHRKIDFLRNFGVRFTHNTNKIEGSTLTLREVDLAINQPDISIQKPTKDIVEAKLHMRCYEDMVNLSDKIGLSMKLIIKWHGILFSMHPNRANFAGIIRRGQIFISGSKYVPPAGGFVCEELLDNLFNWYNKNLQIYHPVLLACLMHYRFVSIHPFDDGNGRISRLLMNFILFRYKYPMFDIPAKIRKSYYNALERSNLKEDPTIFVGWFFKNYLYSIKNLRQTNNILFYM